MSRRYLIRSSRIVALIGILALSLTGEIGRGYMAAAWIGWSLGFLLDYFPARQVALRHAETAAVVLFLGVIGLDFFVQHETVFITLAHFLLLFQIFKCLGPKERKDCLQILLFGFFQILSACTLSVGLVEGCMLFLFVPTASVGFFWHQVEWERERSGAPFSETSHQPYRWATLLLGSGALPVNLLLTASVFLLFPRLNFNLSLPGIGNANTGYSREINLGQTGRLHTSSAPVLWLQFQTNDERLRWKGYLRGDTLESFDGRQWAPGAGRTGHSMMADADGVFALSSETRGAPLLHASVTMINPSGATLFVPGRPLQLKAPMQSVSVNEDGSLHGPAAFHKPIRYDVVAVADPAPLPAADEPWPAEDLDLPALAFPRTQALTRSVAGQGSAEERAHRIESYLRKEMHYSMRLADADAPPSASPLEDFLFGRREGPCAYFASAMAVMLRMEGIPSRIVAGYLHGEWNEPAGQFLVRERDAHAWVEAYFPGTGWQSFDPTPASDPQASRSSRSLWHESSQYWDYLELQWDRLIIEYDLYSQVHALERIQENVALPWLERWTRWHDLHRVRPRKMVRADPARHAMPGNLIFIIILGVAGILGWAGLNRRKEMSLDNDMAVRSYQLFLQRMAHAGFPKFAAETGWEYADRVKTLAAAARESAASLTERYYQARFGRRALLLLLSFALLGCPRAHAADATTADVKKLASALNSGDPDQRERAAEALKALGPAAAPALPALRKALNDDLPYVRTKAAAALASIGAPAVPAFIEALKNDSSDVRSVAAISLGNLGADAAPAIPALVNALKDSDTTVHANAANALEKIGPAATPAIIAALTDENVAVRLLAVQTLADMNDRSDALLYALVDRFKDENSQVVLAAVKALGQKGSAAVPVLIHSLDSENVAIRTQSCTVLADLGHKSKDAVPKLTQLLKDTDPGVRGGAAVALGKIGSAALPAVPALKELKNDPDPVVASKAQEAVTNIAVLFEQKGGQPKQPALTITTVPESEPATQTPAASPHKKSTPRKPAVSAAAKKAAKQAAAAKVPPAVAQLIKQLADVDDVVRLEASQKLTALGPQAVGGLMNAVTHATTTVRVSATVILGQIGPAATPAVPLLTEGLRSPTIELRQPSAVSLLLVDSTTAFAILGDLMTRDPDPDVRMNAIDVIGKTGPAGAPAVPALTEVLRDSNTAITDRASLSLTEIGTPEAVAAVKQYDRMRVNKTVQEAFKTLRSRSPAIDNKSVDTLVKLGSPGVITIATGLKDTNVAVRGGCAKALNRLGQDATPATPALIDALDDADQIVREQAAASLAKINSPEAQSALRFFPIKNWVKIKFQSGTK